MTPPERHTRGDDDENNSWRAGHQGGRAARSPDDYDAPYDSEPREDDWRKEEVGPEGSPDDFDAGQKAQSGNDTGRGRADQGRDNQESAGTAGRKTGQDPHTALQENLGDAYEVIFEIEGLQIRRLGDRAFIAEYIPDKQIVRAAPHVLFQGHENERPEKLEEEGKRRLQEQVDEWKTHGFEALEEPHLMKTQGSTNNIYDANVPRFIQPMAKKVSSVDEAADAVRWIRSHRRTK